MPKRESYHHGDLRAALVEAALTLIAERGIDALSVAEAARRTGVSPGAPYRHFPTRLALLKAAATRAAELLAADLRAATGKAENATEALARVGPPRQRSERSRGDRPGRAQSMSTKNRVPVVIGGTATRPSKRGYRPLSGREGYARRGKEW